MKEWNTINGCKWTFRGKQIFISLFTRVICHINSTICVVVRGGCLVLSGPL